MSAAAVPTAPAVVYGAAAAVAAVRLSGQVYVRRLLPTFAAIR